MTMSVLEVPAELLVVQYREATIEHLDVDKRQMLVRGAPYDVEAQLGPTLWESFAPRTFERTSNKASRVKLWKGHGGEPVGNALTVEDRPDGVWIEYQFSKTIAADEARELARDGTLDQVSVEFKPMKDFNAMEKRAGGGTLWRHTRAHLLGVALVTHGAYDEDAFVASFRDARSDKSAEIAIARLRALTH